MFLYFSNSFKSCQNNSSWVSLTKYVNCKYVRVLRKMYFTPFLLCREQTQNLGRAVEILTQFADDLNNEHEQLYSRHKRDADRGVT